MSPLPSSDWSPAGCHSLLYPPRSPSGLLSFPLPFRVASIHGERNLSLSKTPKCLREEELYFFHNSPPMLISLTTLFVTLSSIFRSRAALQLENLALRHQIGALQRSARKRPG